MKTNEKSIQMNGNSDSPQGVGDRLNMFYGALPILFELARKLRDHQTEAELYLWSQLEHLKYLNVRFKRQHPVLYFVADFYCHKARLVIEVNGGYHDIPEQYKYDKEREHELEELGLKVIRFTNEQVLFHIENSLKVIEEVIKERIPITPRTPNP